MRPTTEEQKKVKNAIPLINDEFIDDYEDDGPVIPQFVKDMSTKNKEESDLPSEEQLMTQALLNNIPNNAEIEEAKHLNELEKVAVNYSEDEWKRLLYHAPSGLMADEFKRRTATYEIFMKATRGALEELTEQKL